MSVQLLFSFNVSVLQVIVNIIHNAFEYSNLRWYDLTFHSSFVSISPFPIVVDAVIFGDEVRND
jgi:hypothetical protein